MAAELRYHPEARNDICEAAEWYDAQEPGLGDHLLGEIRRATETIAAAPQRWRKFDGEYRRYILSRFPYSIVYRMNEEAAVIMAISHQRRRPGHWHDRAEEAPTE